MLDTHVVGVDSSRFQSLARGFPCPTSSPQAATPGTANLVPGGVPRSPKILTAAGIMWIGVGILFALIGAYAGRQPQGLMTGLLGLAFVICGYQTVRGTARDILGSGIASMVLGLLILGGTTAMGSDTAPGTRNAVVAVGTTFFVAGILAFAGQTGYAKPGRGTTCRDHPTLDTDVGPRLNTMMAWGSGSRDPVRPYATRKGLTPVPR